jgi:hypothetical protein
MVLAEQEEIANGIITKKVGDLLKLMNKHNQSYLNEIHITDGGYYYKYPLYLRAVIDIPSEELDDEAALKVMAGIIHMIFEVVDNVAALRLSNSCVEKCTKTRSKIKSTRKEK